MKQLIDFNPVFNPGVSNTGTLDFSQLSGFNVDKLYAVVNLTRNTPVYVPGTSKYGLYSVNGSILTLTLDTSTHSQLDRFAVYYENSLHDSNVSQESGGNLQALQETNNRILKELQVMNYVLATGLNIKRDDVDAIREDLFKGANNVATD